MITPSISLVAWADRQPGFVFVKVPNERGRYVRTDTCVVLTACPYCHAGIGEPCFASSSTAKHPHYQGGTHSDRRSRAARIRRSVRDVKPRYRACDCGGIELLHEGMR